MITGVSSGIGLAASRAAIAVGFHVFGSVRRLEDAPELGEHFTPLLFDVRDRDAIGVAVEQVAISIGNATLAGLIHNAGIAVAGPLLHVRPEEIEKQFAVNVFGVLAVTQAFAPLLGTDRTRVGKPGKIVNVSSVSGKLSFPFVGPYVASKHALEGLSNTLRRELMLYGIDVVLVGPGAIRTPIWEKSNFEEFRETDYAASLRLAEKMMREAALQGMEAEACGELLVSILRRRRPKTRYALVRHSLLHWYLPRILPERWVDAILARQFRLMR